MVKVVPAEKKGFGVLTGLPSAAALRLNGKFPSRAFFSSGRIVFQLTGANIDFLDHQIDGIVWDVPEYEEQKSVQQTSSQVKELKQAEEIELPDYEFGTEPYEHQLRAFVMSRNLEAFGYFMDMGCGKSKVAIDVACDLYERKEISQMLIVAPNGVHEQWVVEQLPIHAPEHLQWNAAFYRSTANKAERDMMNSVFENNGCLNVLTMNIEALSSSTGERFANKFVTRGKTLMLVDESSKIKKPGANRTQACFRLGRLCPYRRIASGSPVTKGVEDLFAQFKFLDPRILGFTSFVTFRNRYCVMGGYEGKQIVDYQNIDDLTSRIEGYSYRVRKQDCLDLPEKVYAQRYVQLTKEQEKAYRQMKEEFLAELDDGSLTTAPEAITRLLRLQQIVCGYLPYPDENDQLCLLVKPESNPRLQATYDLVSGADGRVIVWARFRKDIEQLRQVLKDFQPVTYDGSTTSNEREKAKQDFLKGEAQVFIGNPQAAGTGLNLAVASTVIYYSNSFDAEQRWQSEDRAHRIGQENNVTYYDLISRGTVDTRIVHNLRQKKNVADMTIDGVRELVE